jgi:hypothetical protein
MSKVNVAKKVIKKENKMKEQTNTAIVLSSLEKQSTPLFKKLISIEKIADQQTYEQASILVKKLKEFGKLAETEKRKMLDPVRETEKRIREHFKPFEVRLNEIETTIKLLMSNYLINNRKALEKVDEQFEKGKIKSIGAYTDKVAALQVNSIAATIRKVKKLQINDANKIPREYLIPDENKIFEALKNGESIPGCSIVTVDQIAI